MKIKNRIKSLLRGERGVAMVTVILVGASLTVVASTAAVITVQDFRSGADDRRATEALSFAESGVDRMLMELRSGSYGWKRLNEAGCAQPPIAVPQGDLGQSRLYNAYLTVYQHHVDPRYRLPEVGTWKPGQAWSTANDTRPVCTSHENPSPDTPMLFAIISTGEQTTATRVVRQVVRVRTRGLPIGMFAETASVSGGNPAANSISLITSGDVTGRDKLEFVGYDPYYKLGHFWAGQSMQIAAPAAVHARGIINCARNRPVAPFVQACGADLQEHPEPLNCTANRADNGQSQWDQSSPGTSLSGYSKCSNWTGTPAGPPPYSSFSDADLARARPSPRLTEEDYAMLKQAAKDRGLYCAMNDSNTGTCTTPTTTFQPKDGNFPDNPGIPGVGNHYVAYLEYPPGGDPFAVKRTISWQVSVGPCSDDQSINKSVVIVVRHGSVTLTGQREIVGAFFIPEGQAHLRGSGGIVKIHGTTIAKRIDVGGDAEVMLSPCWINNMPNIFLQARPLSWTEVDR